MNKLEQLRQMSVVVADTGDIEAIRKFQPQDCTTNPSLILKAAQLPGYSPLIHELIASMPKDGDPDDLLDHLTVRIGTELSKIVPGNVSTEVDAYLSYDKNLAVSKARKLIKLYQEQGVGKDRILIKLAATWEGIQAAKELLADGIRCNLTLVFSKEQAITCAQAGVYLISPFVGRITDWYKKDQGVDGFSIDEDPGVQSVKGIYTHFKAHGYQTVVMGASFRSVAQVEALAGCDRLTVSPQLLEELAADEGELTRQLSPQEGHEQEPEITEVQFRWALAANPMANEKLAEGIVNFHNDTEKLRKLLKNF
ncbi:transaldolase (plasmid) [Deinococcus radiomollis]|uniref:transaldolase n=1 Tax=Deinococcus radiomollis TaxID=468916 RepID=UPI003892CC12